MGICGVVSCQLPWSVKPHILQRITGKLETGNWVTLSIGCFSVWAIIFNLLKTVCHSIYKHTRWVLYPELHDWQFMASPQMGACVKLGTVHPDFLDYLYFVSRIHSNHASDIGKSATYIDKLDLWKQFRKAAYFSIKMRSGKSRKAGSTEI